MTTDLNNRTKRSRGGRRSRARLLRAISGLPAGAGPSRRGSFLIMVVGVLALLAVVTILYAAIGRSDRQISAAVVKNDERHSVPEQVRDYLAGVIAADTFSTYFAGEYAENGAPLQRREAWDYPSSPFFVTNPNTGAMVPVTTLNFSPTGLINLGGGLIVGSGTDPWLAASEPTFLNFDANAHSATEEYQRQVDWAHISNFAPDGAPVNLFNLRRGGGNFAATPWEMRRDLRLWDDGTNANPTTDLDFGGTVQDSDSINHRPAEWTARQRAAFRVPRHPVGGVNSYNNLAFPLYQWADADGDGILDSRWFELVEARNPNTPELWRSFLNDRRYRYFIAARAIDLSGRVNVNTATDLADAPSRSNMLGATPSDADLFSLLTMENATLNEGSALTYDRLEQPKQANQPGDYSSLDDPDFIYDMGRAGYSALRQTLFAGLVPPAAWNGTPGWGITRTEYYRDFAGLGMDAAGHDSGAMHTVAAPFNLADLYELLVYNGVNDPATRSRLESAVGGRYLTGGVPYSPLRDNRPLALERGGIDNDGVNDGPNGFLDDDALVHASIDPRRRLTTISAARPILSRLGVTPTTPISATDIRATTEDLFPGGTPAVGTLFQHYADALLPYSYLSAAWSGTPGYSTLFYAHRGPELALRIAAHMAVNKADAYDDDDTLTVRTLLVDATIRQQIIDDMSGNYSPNLLDLGDSRLAQGEPVSAQAINVFGVEAQPFLTEAASFAVYTDTPQALGGDDDTGERTIGDGTGEIKVYARDPSIDGRVLESNPDFLFEVIAFQVHNPFDRAVTLPETGGSFYVQYGDDSYKLVSGAFGGGAASVTIGPRETQVFYTLSNGITEIATRIANITGNPVPTEEATVQDWLDSQLGAVAIRVPLADINTGTIDTSNAFRDLQNGTDESRRVLRLWRTSGVAPLRVLVDRLRDPAPAGVSLDRQLSGHGPGQQGGVSGAQRGPEPPDSAASPDNSGLSITRFASIRRKDDPRGGATSDPPRSVIPAYCIESKWQDTLQNAMQSDDTGSRLSIGDFSGTKGDKTLDGLLNKQAGPAGQAILPTLKQGPDDKSGQPIGANIAGRSLDGSMPGETPLYAVPSLDNQRFEESGGVSRMRVADLLLPLGIGPTFDPALADEQDQWTTLSEAVAIALYYENPPAGDLYHNAFQSGAGIAVGPALEAGQLVLDDFVPFFDANDDGLFDATTDQRWGLGVPMAMTILDRFTTMPRRFGSTSIGTFGVINVNTAPLAVLRAIPMFSPAVPDPAGGPSWWWFGSGHDETSDIAATLYAYRDRLAVYPRDFAGVPTNLLNFRDGSNGAPSGSPPGYDPADDGRLFATGIPAIREMPGLLTPGELLAARDTQYPDDAAFPHDIDRLGFNGQNVSHSGLESVRYGTGGAENDDLADDWAERLVIANAAMSGVSVRSDVFAVWFVLHGYQESDVKGLANDQPMTPSIARRFLMVVDRSNVVRPGDKPRILLFKEVPL